MMGKSMPAISKTGMSKKPMKIKESKAQMKPAIMSVI